MRKQNVWTLYKYLGLALDVNLYFDKKIDHVKLKIRPFINFMRTKGRYILIEKRKQTYHATCIRSQLNCLYILTTYSEGLKTKILELQRVQNQCIKATNHLPRLTYSTNLYSSRFKILQLSEEWLKFTKWFGQ